VDESSETFSRLLQKSQACKLLLIFLPRPIVI
jgi:hypothetical protein